MRRSVRREQCERSHTQCARGQTLGSLEPMQALHAAESPPNRDILIHCPPAEKKCDGISAPMGFIAACFCTSTSQREVAAGGHLPKSIACRKCRELPHVSRRTPQQKSQHLSTIRQEQESSNFLCLPVRESTRHWLATVHHHAPRSAGCKRELRANSGRNYLSELSRRVIPP